jgi:hypothetical protein
MTPEEFFRLREELRRAREKLGSRRDTLRWFLEFAERDLESLSPTEQLLEGYRLLASAAGTEHSPSPEDWLAVDLTKLITLAALKRAQREVVKAIRVLLSDKARWTVPTSNVHLEIIRSSEGKDQHFGLELYIGRRLELGIGGLFNALFEAGKYLRKCARCSKPFVATKRQEYCSTNCSQIVRNEKKKRIKEELKAKRKPK